MASFAEIKAKEAERRRYAHELPSTLVVFGAGASIDCFARPDYELLNSSISTVNATERSRHVKLRKLFTDLPPLTRDLTSALRPFASGCDQLLDLIDQHQANESSAFDFEETLKHIYATSAGSNPDDFFALRKALVERMKLADGIGVEIPTLYTSMFSRINHSGHLANRELIVFNMNYDRLAEYALTNRKGIDSIAEYVVSNRNWNLYHPHGNCAWSIHDGHILKQEWLEIENHAAGDKLYGKYMNATPALSLPMYGDAMGKLVLPTAHRKHLKNQLPNVDKIIVIGWRGADEEIVQIINSDIDQTKINEIHLVGTSENTISTLLANLDSWISRETVVTKFVSPSAFRDYLSDPDSPFNKDYPL